MTHRRSGLVFLAGCALGVWTSLGAAEHAGDGPSVAVRAFRESFIRGGEPLYVLVTVGSVDPNITVTLDPLGVSSDGFVHRLPPSGFTFCPDDCGCWPCPQGHRCFGNSTSLNLDYRLAGHVEVPVTITEGNGRSTRTSLVLDVRPATDADRDGMADQLGAPALAERAVLPPERTRRRPGWRRRDQPGGIPARHESSGHLHHVFRRSLDGRSGAGSEPVLCPDVTDPARHGIPRRDPHHPDRRQRPPLRELRERASHVRWIRPATSPIAWSRPSSNRASRKSSSAWRARPPARGHRFRSSRSA